MVAVVAHRTGEATRLLLVRLVLAGGTLVHGVLPFRALVARFTRFHLGGVLLAVVAGWTVGDWGSQASLVALESGVTVGAGSIGGSACGATVRADLAVLWREGASLTEGAGRTLVTGDAVGRRCHSGPTDAVVAGVTVVRRQG